MLRLVVPRKPGAGSGKAARFTHWPLASGRFAGTEKAGSGDVIRPGRRCAARNGIGTGIVVVVALLKGMPVWRVPRTLSSQPPITASTIFDEGAYSMPGPMGR